VRSRLALGVVLCLGIGLSGVLAGGCGKKKSFIHVYLRSSSSTVPIVGVTRVEVDVTQPPSQSAMLHYVAHADDTPFAINQDPKNTVDFSIGFTAGRSGVVSLDVAVYDASNCRVGGADGVSATIREGDYSSITIDLQPLHDCTQSDGGVDAPEGDTFMGCDPVSPACGAGQTCQVNCNTQAGECTAGGSGGQGTACSSNKDCAPGLQCFDYGGAGCVVTGTDAGVKVCLHYCNDSSNCGSGGGNDAGAGDAGESATGTRSVCEGVVPCGKIITAYHTCTFGCDPRQSAAAGGTSRCPTGLSCLVVGSMDQVDCACPEASRKGTDGVACTGGADCAPGFICNMMGGEKKCRGVCRCDANNMTCTAANECTGGKTCAALTNETTFGVCL
jgi:hypothetical protein